MRLKPNQELAELFEPKGDFSFTVNDIRETALISSDPALKTSLHPFRPHADGKSEYFEHIGPGDDETYYGMTQQIGVQGQIYWIQVTREVERGEERISVIADIFLKSAVWIIPPFLAVMLFITIWMVCRAVSPLQAASVRAEAIGPRNPEARLLEAGMPSEALPLIKAVNAALDRLQEALKRQEEFAADAAHELLTPLAVLTAYFDTLEDKQIAAALKGDVEGMTDVVNQLLELADLEARAEPPSELVDLRAVCQQVAEQLAPLAIGAKKSLSVTGSDRPVWVRGCQEALARVVRNLVDNGLAQVSAGAGKVEIDVRDDATIRVIDNGPGIPADYRAVIFDRHWRGSVDRRGGAGLGLSIVLRILEAHRGNIDVSDAPGETPFSRYVCRAPKQRKRVNLIVNLIWTEPRRRPLY